MLKIVKKIIIIPINIIGIIMVGFGVVSTVIGAYLIEIKWWKLKVNIKIIIH